MKNFKLQWFVIIALFFTSCNNENSTTEDFTNQTSTTATTTFSKASSNPHSQVGVLHNEFMNMMHNNPNISSQDEVVSTSMAFFQANGYNTSLLSFDKMKQVANESMNSQFTADKINELATRFGFSGAYKAELYKLAAFFNADNYASTSDIINKLDDLEAQFLNAQLPDHEKDQLLLTIAVTKASMNYWIAYYPNDLPGQSGASKAKWFSRVFGGAVADAFGALIGGAVGTVGGPVGTVVGAAVGAAAASGGIQFAIEY